ncbi:hypothetical protein PQX77_019490 [Marasmius sp. AFHP31]|nr:hypothetical protein PQX77_019490 [Marasmius sp. AFHP31]
MPHRRARSSSPSTTSPWNNHPPSFTLRSLDAALLHVHAVLKRAYLMPERLRDYWTSVFDEIEPDMTIIATTAILDDPTRPLFIRGLHAVASALANSTQVNAGKWTLPMAEALPIVLNPSTNFDLATEPLRSSYLQPFCPNVHFEEMSIPLDRPDRPDTNAPAGSSTNQAPSPSARPRPAKRHWADPVEEKADTFAPPTSGRRSPSMPLQAETRSFKGGSKATTPKAPSSKKRSKAKGKQKANSAPLHRAYVLVPPLKDDESVEEERPRRQGAPHIPEEARTAGVQPQVEKFELALRGRANADIPKLSLDRLYDVQTFSDPYIEGSWCNFCTAGRKPSCVPEIRVLKGKGGGSNPVIRCSNCNGVRGQICSFGHDSPINQTWRSVGLQANIRHPDFIKRIWTSLDDLTIQYNKAIEDARLRMEAANDLRRVIEDQLALFRMVGADPQMFMGMISHDHEGGPLSSEGEQMVAAIMGWETVPSVQGFQVKKTGEHYFLYDAHDKLVSSTDPDVILDTASPLPMDVDSPPLLHDSGLPGQLVDDEAEEVPPGAESPSAAEDEEDDEDSDTESSSSRNKAGSSDEESGSSDSASDSGSSEASQPTKVPVTKSKAQVVASSVDVSDASEAEVTIAKTPSKKIATPPATLPKAKSKVVGSKSSSSTGGATTMLHHPTLPTDSFFSTALAVMNVRRPVSAPQPAVGGSAQAGASSVQTAGSKTSSKKQKAKGSPPKKAQGSSKKRD